MSAPTVDETLDVGMAFVDLRRPLNAERWRWIEMGEDVPAGVKGPFDAMDESHRQGVLTIVAMVDARRHTAKVAHLAGAERQRALELLARRDTTVVPERGPWCVFWQLGDQLRELLATDADVRRTVTDVLAEADEAATAALAAVEAELARVGLEPVRVIEARERAVRAELAEAEAADLAELKALGVA